MKVSILQENLNKGLSIVSRIINSKVTLPILGNILLTAEEGKLKLTATNLEVSINLWLPAKKEKEGKFTIPAKDLTEFVNALPADKVLLEEKQEKLQVVSGNYKAVFNGTSAAEFPHVPSLKDKKTSSNVGRKFELEVEEFVKAVNLVCFAAAQDETRPVLTGVRLSCLNNELQLVATDGYRLSLKRINLKEKLDIPTLIIPARALIEVIKAIEQREKSACADREGEKKLQVAVTKQKNQVIFSYGNLEVIARLIEGEFPDFQKIIPEKGESKAVIDTEELIRAVRTASIFARKSANIVRLNFDKKMLTIQANAPEIGENEIKIPVEFEGEKTEIAFNFRFLQDFLSYLDKETLSVALSGALKPGLFRGIKDNSFLHIIMPVRLQGE